MKVLLVFFLTALPLLAQCETGNCPPPSAIPMAPPMYIPLPAFVPPPVPIPVEPRMESEPIKQYARITVDKNDRHRVLIHDRRGAYIGAVYPDSGEWQPEGGEKIKERPRLVIHDSRGEYLGTFYSGTGEWQYAGKDKLYDLRAFSAQWHGPQEETKANKPPRIYESEQVPKPKAAVEESSSFDKPTKPDMPEWMIGGVDRKEIPTGREKYMVNGREITRSDAIDLVSSGGSIPDDKNNCRITVIGSEQACQRVVADLNRMPRLSEFCVIQSYRPDNWRIQSGGFSTPVRPEDAVIYLQKPNGEVLWRQDTYEGGADALYAQLRDRVPDYDPKKDPQPTPGKPDPKPDGKDDGVKLPSGPWLWIIAAVVGTLVFTRMGGK